MHEYVYYLLLDKKCNIPSSSVYFVRVYRLKVKEDTRKAVKILLHIIQNLTLNQNAYSRVYTHKSEL